MTALFSIASLLLAVASAEEPAAPSEGERPVTAAPPEVTAAEATAVTAGLVLMVDDRAATLEAAVDLATQHGGWFESLGTDHVRLRVPALEARDSVDALRGLGTLVERSFQSHDLSPQLIDLESRLRARREVLARYEAVLDEANAASVVAVERQITGVVAEIEQLEGRRRSLVHQAKYASIDLSLRYRDRQAPSRDGASSFAWLNTLNVADLVEDFEYGVRRQRASAQVPVPEGFAPWRNQRRFQAISPDEVAFRVRTARNRPRADLSYWRDALRSRMQDAGYTELSVADIQAGDTPGVLLELGAANGEQDQVYLVAVFVCGRKLVLAEATGEASRYQTRRGAVLAALEGMDIR